MAPDVAKLIEALPPDTVLTDPDLVAGYRQDWARDPDAGTPLAVVRARTTEDVQETLRWASANRVPVVPRGAGTSLSGGSTGVEGGITLSTERMRTITVDPVTRVAVAQPGAFNAEVKRAAAEQGFWYPPDPSSFEICSIGGNAATNAGGLCCVKYGVTTDYVLGMQVVLADGTAVRLGGPRLKDVAGLSLTKLFVGSEGTLGVITELTLRLLPAPPAAATLVANFPTIEAAAEAVVAITRRLRPAMLELMDNGSINAVEDMVKMGLDRTAGALLLARSDAPGDAAAAEIAQMEAVCAEYGAADAFSTSDADEGEAFIAARRAAFPAMERMGTLLLEDVGVPVPDLPALVHGVRAIAEKRDTNIVVVAHAGDGNTHPIITFPPGDTAAEARARVAFGEIMDLALSLGGTITGEHGVGRLKAPWLPAQLGPDVLALTRRIKDALDPDGILNPGVIPRVSPVTVTLLVIGGALAVADWVAVQQRLIHLEYLLKPAAIALLIAAAVTTELGKAGPWVLVALVFSLLGDVGLMLSSGRTDAPFVAGLAAFLVGHVCYIVGFTRQGVRLIDLFAGALVVLGAAGLTVPQVLVGASAAAGKRFAGVVSVYALVLSGTTVLAAGTGLVGVAIGGVLFLASDTLIAWQRFVRPVRLGPLAVIVTYHVAQYLFVIGLAGANSR